MTKFNIRGFWFSNECECIHVSSVICDILKELRKDVDNISHIVKPHGINVDILTILKQAFNEYNIDQCEHKVTDLKTCTHRKQSVALQTSDNGIEKTPKSVSDFFDKFRRQDFCVASDIHHGPIQSNMHPRVFSRHGPIEMMPKTFCCSTVPYRYSDDHIRSFLQQLKLNPIYSVTYIEKKLVCHNQF